jgi:hypothetical protein
LIEFQIVVPVHRKCDATKCKVFYKFHAFRNFQVYRSQLIFFPSFQNIIYLAAFGISIAYSEPEFGILICLQDFFDAFQAIVTT